MTVLAGEASTARAASTRSRGQRVKPVRPIRAEVTDVPRRPSPAMRQARQAVPTTKVPRGNYQAVILAEFVAAIVLTAATPIASKRNSGGLSPYAAGDMVQLAAITILYFVLALVSTGGGTAARLSAWFGGLILIAVGLTEATTIAKTLNVFGTSVNPTPASSSGGVASGTTAL